MFIPIVAPANSSAKNHVMLGRALEPVFLDKAVADQLRIRQRRHQRHGGHSRAQQCLGDRHPTVRLRHHRGANRGT